MLNLKHQTDCFQTVCSERPFWVAGPQSPSVPSWLSSSLAESEPIPRFCFSPVFPGSKYRFALNVCSVPSPNSIYCEVDVN